MTSLRRRCSPYATNPEEPIAPPFTAPPIVTTLAVDPAVLEFRGGLLSSNSTDISPPPLVFTIFVSFLNITYTLSSCTGSRRACASSGCKYYLLLANYNKKGVVMNIIIEAPFQVLSAKLHSFSNQFLSSLNPTFGSSNEDEANECLILRCPKLFLLVHVFYITMWFLTRKKLIILFFFSLKREPSFVTILLSMQMRR